MIQMEIELMRKLLQIFVNLFKKRPSNKNQMETNSVYLDVCNASWYLKVAELKRLLLKS